MVKTYYVQLTLKTINEHDWNNDELKSIIESTLNSCTMLDLELDAVVEIIKESN